MANHGSVSPRRILAIARKELRHVARDWQTLMIILAMPVIMMFLYGYALTMDLQDTPVIVESPRQSPAIQRICDAINATTMFAITDITPVIQDPQELFRQRPVKVILRIPATFEKDLRNGGTAAPIQVLIDGSDPNTGTILRNVFEPMLLSTILDILQLEQPNVISIDKRILYNQEQKSALYFVPGLMAIILLMISALLTSLAITREKETGTMEQLLVSPVISMEIVMGKIIPYILLAAADGALILFVGQIAFGVTVQGSYLLLAAISVLYIFTCLAIGLLVSTVAATQQQAMMMVLPLTMMPSMLLSGFIFPVASMPLPLQIVSRIIPATHFLVIIRAIILKGVGITAFWQSTAALGCIGLVLVIISIRKFKVQL